MYFSSKFKKQSDNNWVFNTYDDWKLIPESRPVIAPASYKANQIDIPGADGSEDLTTALTGYPVFSNRTGSNKYIVEPDTYDCWLDVYSEIMNRINGQKLKMYFDDEEPEYYYEGRWKVDSWENGDNWPGVSISYEVYPYKMKDGYSCQDPLWDTFNFERDYVFLGAVDGHMYASIAQGETKDVLYSRSSDFSDGDVVNIFGTMPTVPEFNVRPRVTGQGNSATINLHFVNSELGIDIEKAILANDAGASNWISYPEMVITMQNDGTGPTHLVTNNIRIRATNVSGNEATVSVRFKMGRL